MVPEPHMLKQMLAVGTIMSVVVVVIIIIIIVQMRKLRYRECYNLPSNYYVLMPNQSFSINVSGCPTKLQPSH